MGRSSGIPQPSDDPLKILKNSVFEWVYIIKLIIFPNSRFYVKQSELDYSYMPSFLLHVAFHLFTTPLFDISRNKYFKMYTEEYLCFKFQVFRLIDVVWRIFWTPFHFAPIRLILLPFKVFSLNLVFRRSRGYFVSTVVFTPIRSNFRK